MEHNYKVGLPGQKFGMLTVVKEDRSRKSKYRYVICKCECGNMTSLPVSHFGRTRSCGCLKEKSRVVHGMASAPEYAIWKTMKTRCHNPNYAEYHNYGGRGITVCEEWRNDFQAFYDHIGSRPGPGYSVDRIDNGKGYEPGNVCWATRSEQNRNTRVNRILTHNGKSQTMIAWSEELGITYDTLQSRLDLLGWSIDQALSTPVRRIERRLGGDNRVLTHNGVNRSMSGWAKELGISVHTLRSRLDQMGWSIDQALSTPVRKKVRKKAA